MGESHNSVELDIVRRDAECLVHRGCVRAMSPMERDRHVLVMLLGLARAQKEASDTALLAYGTRVGSIQRSVNALLERDR